jgi:hypothetical protein
MDRRLRRVLREGRQRPVPGDPVNRESPRVLKAAKRVFGLRVEESVDRHKLAAPSEEELQHRYIPAELPAVERALPEQRPAQRPERAAGRTARPSVRVQTDAPLKALHGPNGRRPGDAVDLAEIEAVCAQGDLQTRRLRIGGRRPSRKGREDERHEADGPPHGGSVSPRAADSSR